MIKKCLICNKEFETLPSGGARKYCFECSPSYQKGDNKGRAVAITCIRQAIKRQLVKYKGGKCEKCGYDNSIWAMQFHHKNPENKDFELSNKYNNGVTDMQKLYEEVAKCNLLCANCHAEEHEKDFLNK